MKKNTTAKKATAKKATAKKTDALTCSGCVFWREVETDKPFGDCCANPPVVHPVMTGEGIIFHSTRPRTPAVCPACSQYLYR